MTDPAPTAASRHDDHRRRAEIGGRLQAARRMAGMSQLQAARGMKMHRPTISMIEAGDRRVNAEELVRFAALYHVDPSVLLGAAGPPAAASDNPLVTAIVGELGKLPPESLDKLIHGLTALRQDIAMRQRMAGSGRRRQIRSSNKTVAGQDDAPSS